MISHRTTIHGESYCCNFCGYDNPTEQDVQQHIQFRHRDRMEAKPGPFVSCIMPTTAARRAFTREAIRMFYEQTYKHSELVIVADALDDVDPDLLSSRVHLTVAHGTIGAKRNTACQRAGGEVIFHWDDDDWHAPDRIEKTLETLCNKPGALVCGQPTILFYQPSEQRAWRFRDWVPFLGGSTLMYWKHVWESQRFEDVQIGEDHRFLSHFPPERWAIAPDDLTIATAHDGNTSPKRQGEMSQPEPYDPERVRFKPSKLLLSYIVWDTWDIANVGLIKLLNECEILNALGHEAVALAIDNGSKAGEWTKGLAALKHIWDRELEVICMDKNRGVSPARNAAIDAALNWGASHLLMLDGDIHPIPWSVFAMLDQLEKTPKSAVLGAWSGGYTRDPKKATPELTYVDQRKVSTRQCAVAWTQYGLFRTQPFRDGARFDLAGPFGTPGWGFEDDDLGFQLARQGWKNSWFTGAEYFHAINSSHNLLRAARVDPASAFESRKLYLTQKWHGVPCVRSELDRLQALHFSTR